MSDVIDGLFEVGRAIKDKMREKNITPTAAREQVKKTYEGKIRPAAKKYVTVLIFITLIALFLPMVFTVSGALLNSKTLTVIGGLLRVLFTVALAVMITPIAVTLEIILRGREGSGERYVKFIIGLCISELFFTLLICFIPLKDNADMIAPFVIGSVILGFLNAWFFSPKYIAGITGLLFIAMIASFFMPHAQERSLALIKGFGKEVGSPKLVSKSCEQLKKEGIFYSADGSNKYWYHIGRDGQLRLYDGKGKDIIDRADLRPFESGMFFLYCQQKNYQAEKSHSSPPVSEERSQDKKPDVKNNYYDYSKKESVSRHESNPYIADNKFLNTEALREIAVVILDKKGTIDSEISDLIASSLRSSRVNVTSSLFKPSFVTSGAFRHLYAGGGKQGGNYDFTGNADYLVLGKAEHSQGYDNFFRKNKIKVVIAVRIISTDSGKIAKELVVEGESLDEDKNRAYQFAKSVAVKDLRQQVMGAI